jgi:hypothetical protein
VIPLSYKSNNKTDPTKYYETKDFGSGISKKTDGKISIQKEIAALIISLAYLKKMQLISLSMI